MQPFVNEEYAKSFHVPVRGLLSLKKVIAQIKIASEVYDRMYVLLQLGDRSAFRCIKF